MNAPGAAALVLAAAVAATACGPRDTERALDLGDQQVRVRIPGGWEAIDQGRQFRVRKGASELVLQDLGPVGPAGIRREVERARELWRSGQGDAALARMGRIPVPRELFATNEARNEFWAAWSGVSRSPATTPIADLEPAFEDILALVNAMPPHDLSALEPTALAELGHDQRRDIKSRTSLRIDGRDALDLATWTRQSHEGPQRLLLVLNDGYLLALSTRQSADPEAARAFDSFRDGLHFAVDAPRR